jgi:hypothetical protein
MAVSAAFSSLECAATAPSTPAFTTASLLFGGGFEATWTVTVGSGAFPEEDLSHADAHVDVRG